MKKKLIFMALLASAASFTCCDDDDINYEIVETVTVESADLEFSPDGGTGTISFAADGTVKVSTSTSWCTADISGNKVTVNVEKYDGKENRYAVVKLTCGEGEASVTVHQFGNYFILAETASEYHFEDTGGELEIPVVHSNYVPEIKASDSWLSVDYKDNIVKISVSANNTRKPRTGLITVGERTLSIDQWTFDTTFGGEYIWEGTTTSTGSTKNSMTVKLCNYDKEAGTCDILLDELAEGCVLTVPFDVSTRKINLKAGQCVGTYQYNGATTYICTLVYASGYISWTTSYSGDIYLEFDEETGKWGGSLTDNGSYAGKVVSGYYFELFNALPAASTSRMKITFGLKGYNLTLRQK